MVNDIINKDFDKAIYKLFITCIFVLVSAGIVTITLNICYKIFTIFETTLYDVGFTQSLAIVITVRILFGRW